MEQDFVKLRDSADGFAIVLRRGVYGNLFSISCLAETRRKRYLSCFVIDGPEFRSDLADSMLVKLSLGQVGAGFAYPISLRSRGIKPGCAYELSYYLILVGRAEGLGPSTS